MGYRPSEKHRLASGIIPVVTEWLLGIKNQAIDGLWLLVFLRATWNVGDIVIKADLCRGYMRQTKSWVLQQALSNSSITTLYPAQNIDSYTFIYYTCFDILSRLRDLNHWNNLSSGETVRRLVMSARPTNMGCKATRKMWKGQSQSYVFLFAIGLLIEWPAHAWI